MMRGRTESGFVAMEWVIGLGLMVLPLAIIAVSVAPWFERASMARLMAQESARTMVLSDDWASGDVLARDLARQIAANYGFSDSDWCGPAPGCLSISIAGEPTGVLGRGSEVTVNVEVPMPGIAVPFLAGATEFQWDTEHTERVDDYRSFP